MSEKMKMDDAALHAFVDGELDAAASAEVDAWLQHNPADKKRVANWQRQAHELRQAYDPVLDEPLPPQMSAQVLTGAVSRPVFWSAQALAASILLAIGALGGWYFTPGTAVQVNAVDVIAARAQSAHVVYVSEVRHPVEVRVNETQHLMKWLSKRLGQPLIAPDLGDTGFFLMGGRLLAEDSKPAAQFMYENASGARITLYVAINPTGQETAFRIASNETTKSFYWLDGPLGFAITGEVNQPKLLDIARSAYDQLTLPS